MPDINRRIAEFEETIPHVNDAAKSHWISPGGAWAFDGYGDKTWKPRRLYDFDLNAWPPVYAKLEEEELDATWVELLARVLGYKHATMYVCTSICYQIATATPAQRAEAMRRVLDGLEGK